jgi:hypothetical protein
MVDVLVITCPYCGEQVELDLEPGEQGDLVYGCDFCSSSMRVVVRRDEWGDPQVEVQKQE